MTLQLSRALPARAWRGVLAAVLILLACAAPTLAAQPSPMNVLILYADDLGYGDLSIQNSKSKIQTPNLDALAKSGLRFTDGHSSSGICTPSRYALLTGRHHWRDFHGIVGPMGKSVFDASRLTMPEMMQQSGYTTAAIGKWHLGWDWQSIKKPNAKPPEKQNKHVVHYGSIDWSQPIPDGPLAHGFDSYFGDSVINFPPYCWIENDRVPVAPDTMMDTGDWPKIKEGRWECRDGPAVSTWNPYENIPTTTKRGVDFINAQRDAEQPFFLYFAFPSPHAPIIPNDKFDGKSDAGAYGDFVFETDDAIGQLLKALDDSGQAENTIVIFSADNGPENYAYPRDAKFDHWSAAPFRGLKRDIYEGGHHVPFMVRWPGLTKAGGTSDALVSQIDIMATLANYLKVDLPSDAAEDSHNLLPVIADPAAVVRTSHVHNTYAKKFAIRQGDWLLVNADNGFSSRSNPAWETKHGYSPDDESPVELYNLATDIGQRDNIASDFPERVAELQSLLAKIQSQGHSAPRLAK